MKKFGNFKNFLESEQKSFKCSTKEKSVKTVLRMEQIKLEEDRKNQFVKVSLLPVLIRTTSSLSPDSLPV